MKINVLIVDDEKLARELIRSLVSPLEDIEVVGEAASGREAIKLVNRYKPDLMFLDIQMPGISGMEVVRKIDPGIMPYIIFITAYNQYAIKAFEVNALDYILKPFEKERFFRSVKRAKEVIHKKELARLTERILHLTRTYSLPLTDIPAEETKKPAYLQHITVREGHIIKVVNAVDIVWLEAANQYVKIHTMKKSYLISQTLISLHKQLNPGQFYRVHRSAVINVKFIKEIHAGKSGSYNILLSTGKRLTLSRNRRGILNDLLKHCP